MSCQIVCFSELKDFLRVSLWFGWFSVDFTFVLQFCWFLCIFVCMIALRVFFLCSSLFLVDFNVFLMITKWVVRLCFFVSWRMSYVFYLDFDDFLMIWCVFSNFVDFLHILYVWFCFLDFCLCSSLFLIGLMIVKWVLHKLKLVLPPFSFWAFMCCMICDAPLAFPMISWFHWMSSC